MGGWDSGLGGAATGASIGSVIPGLGTGIGALIGGLGGLLFGGKKSQGQPTQYTTGMSPQDTAFRQMLMQYIQQQMQAPRKFVQTNSATPDALNLIYRKFFNKGFTAPGYGTTGGSAPGAIRQA